MLGNKLFTKNQMLDWFKFRAFADWFKFEAFADWFNFKVFADWFKFKAFADNILSLAEMNIIVCKSAENLVGKKEIMVTSIFICPKGRIMLHPRSSVHPSVCPSVR